MGYYKYNTLVLDTGAIITGKIIHSNNKYIYIIEEENKLSQYFIDEIKAYTIKEDVNSEKNKTTESIGELVEDELDFRSNGF